MTTAPLRLGVVVLNWNGRSHLEACLRSLAQSDHPDHFVVVVDNGSEDDSVAWMRTHHPEVELVALEDNLRFAGGNNVGAARALERDAEVLLVLNNDTEVEVDTLLHLARVFDDDRVGVAGPRIVYAGDRDRIWYGGGRYHRGSGRAAHRALRRSVHESRDPAGPTDWVTGCALAVRAQAWRELLGLDESFYIYAEDVDLCLRARAAGWQIRYEPRALVAHAVSASVGGHFSPFKAYHRTRSRRQLFRRHGQRGLGVLVGLGYDLALAGWLLARGAPRASLAVLEALREGENAPPRHPTTELRPLA